MSRGRPKSTIDPGDALESIRSGGAIDVYPQSTLSAIGKLMGLSGVSGLSKDKLIGKIQVALIAEDPDSDHPIPELTYLVLDTETTLIGTGATPARLLQLGYQIWRIDRNGDPYLVLEYESLVKPSGFTVSGTDIHGITEDMANTGRDVGIVLEQFNNDMNEFDVDILVAHNFPFDWNVISGEFNLLDIENLPILDRKRILSFDTCRTSPVLTYVQVKADLKRASFPTLSLLYEILFNRRMETAHRALDDVKMTSDCLFELLRLGVLDLTYAKQVIMRQ